MGQTCLCSALWPNERRVGQETPLLITAVKISLRSVENLSWEDLESSLPWNYLLPILSPSKAKLKPYREGVTLPRSLSKPEQRILKAENTIQCVKTQVRLSLGWAGLMTLKHESFREKTQAHRLGETQVF